MALKSKSTQDSRKKKPQSKEQQKNTRVTGHTMERLTQNGQRMKSIMNDKIGEK